MQKGSADRTIPSALLDYYSDKASAEASAVVATTFGLFVVLTASGNDFWRLVLYWVLWWAGLYFLIGFGYWCDHANWAKAILAGRPLPEDNAKKKEDKGNKKGEREPKGVDSQEGIDREIENLVKERWRQTFLRSCYYSLKF